MGVVHHGAVWHPTDRNCAAMRDIRRIAEGGDADELSRAAFRFRRAAAGCHDMLSVFGIDDDAYLDRWISPPAFDPALVAVLAWLPGMKRLDETVAGALVALHRTTVGDGFRSATPFHTLYAILARMTGPVVCDRRRSIGHLGQWARASTIARYAPDELRRELLSGLTDPRRTWLVVNTLC